MMDLKLIRNACTLLAFVLLFGGYAAHQWALINGNLGEWIGKISGPNLMIGWLFVVLSTLFCLVREPEEKEVH